MRTTDIRLALDELLNRQGFQVLQDKKNFSVVLPLIWSKVADQKLLNIETS